MADTGEILIADLLGSTDARLTVIGDRALQNIVQPDVSFPRIWMQRRTSEEPTGTLDANAGDVELLQEVWDVECHVSATEANDAGADTIQDMVAGVRAKWHNRRGTIGSTDGNYGTVQAMFITDHDDDYIYKGLDSAEGVHLAALEVELWRATT